MKTDDLYTVIISGGGTGGHIFPAIAIAKAFEKLTPCKIIFIGALGRMEMEKVPAAGYPIIGLPIAGLQRKLDWRNLLLPYLLLKSIIIAWKKISEFKPNAVIGVGGYASAPLLIAAWLLKKPIFIQEQNAYAGLTNKWLGKVAKKIFVAFDRMDAYFPEEKIVHYGNPIRQELELDAISKIEGCSKFHFNPDKPVLLVIGGSLGAPAINHAVAKGVELWLNEGIQILWQTGKNGKSQADKVANHKYPMLQSFDFIYNMPDAFAAADLIVSRAGAIAISEICAQGKASILVPSPYVAEDHQRINAMVLSRVNACVILDEKNISDKLQDLVLETIGNKTLIQTLGQNAKSLHRPGSAKNIAEHILNLTRKQS